jgi:transposase/transcriptional regulator with XRE-family HTH domain
MLCDMARPIRPLTITSEQRRELRAIINRPTATVRENRRAWIILNRANGLSQTETAGKVHVARPVVVKWEQRFRKTGLAGLAESKGRGRKPWIDPKVREKIVVRATQPPPNRSRWSVRSMAKSAGVSKATVQRIWSANDIKPHVVRTFKLSNDKNFEVKFWDVIGLYLNPPDRALILCCDEKSQCQALERTQPSLPLKGGHPCTRTHDYKRHGTITLFAALSYLDGKIFSQTAAKHTHRQWLAFLKQLDAQTPGELTLHLIADNYSTHKHPKVKSWIKWRNKRQQKAHGRDRIALHFIPTSSSWMNLVERFFRDLTEDVVREGSFTSVQELVQSITGYLEERNLSPKRYVWKAKGAEILAKIKKARETLEKMKCISNSETLH